ncbi:MAG: UDP-N-acetylmuramate dehydrogenase [Gammaproteobacteria bacterium]|nr:UDP-N-acetylmuramate dehydrogenase [Gammaproteobacteria bacterium]
MGAIETSSNATLQGMNTMGVAVRARRLVTVKQLDAMERALDQVAADAPLLVLGGGSNILFRQDFDGTVLHIADQEIDVSPGNGGDLVTVAAGAEWDGFVRWSLAQGYAGLENLILIPGSVGAAPIQNIGAYGREVSEFIEAVDVIDRATRERRRLSPAECEFGYRDSIFKRERDRYIVIRVIFRLPRQHPLRTDYAGVQQWLDDHDIDDPRPADVAQAVESLRRSKLPDPADIGNTGSFFKNPIVSSSKAEAVRAAFPDAPVFPLDDEHAKLSAGWMIEHCGLKGTREGDAGFSAKHALVLVNHGEASGEQLWSMAQRAIDAVEGTFGIRLEPEPLVL